MAYYLPSLHWPKWKETDCDDSEHNSTARNVIVPLIEYWFGLKVSIASRVVLPTMIVSFKSIVSVLRKEVCLYAYHGVGS